MIIIEYWIEYKAPRTPFGCYCCGDFRDLKHFETFKSIESYYGRVVSKANIVWGS